MGGVDARLLDGIRAWLGEGPGARRLGLAASAGPAVIHAVGMEDHYVEASGAATTVVVLDGEVPIGSDELAMLVEVPAPAGGVVFALVGGGWSDQVVERSRALLAAFTPGLEAAPMVPLRDSAALAEAVAAAESRMLGRDRVAEIAASAVEFEVARQQRKLGELRRDPECDGLRAERAAMLRSRLGAQGLGGASGLPGQLAGLRAAFALARVDLGHEIAGRCRHMSSTVRTELDAGTKADLRGFPNRLRDALSGLAEDLDRGISGRLSGVATNLPTAHAGGPEPVLEEPRGRAFGFDDRLMIVMGASGGLGLGRLLMTPLQVVGLPQALSVPIMLALGAALAWWIVRARANAGDRQRMRQWAGEAIADFKAQWERLLAQRSLDAEAAAVGTLGDKHARVVQDTERRLAELDARLSRLGRERDGRTMAINNRLAQGARLHAALAPHVLCSVAPMGVEGEIVRSAGRIEDGTNNVDVG